MSILEVFLTFKINFSRLLHVSSILCLCTFPMSVVARENVGQDIWDALEGLEDKDSYMSAPNRKKSAGQEYRKRKRQREALHFFSFLKKLM